MKVHQTPANFIVKDELIEEKFWLIYSEINS